MDISWIFGFIAFQSSLLPINWLILKNAVEKNPINRIPNTIVIIDDIFDLFDINDPIAGVVDALDELDDIGSNFYILYVFFIS